MMVASLTACGSKGETTTDAAADTTTEETTDAAAEDTAAEDTAAAGETKDLADLKLAFIVDTENELSIRALRKVSKLSVKNLVFRLRHLVTGNLTETSVLT